MTLEQHSASSVFSRYTYDAGGKRGGELLVVAEAPSSAAANVAAGKAATQASTYDVAVAARAVDGNTNGNWAANSVTHTLGGAREWWQVDLGQSYALQQVKVWNRTDCCGERLSDFYVFVSDAPFASADLAATLAQSGVTAYHTPGQGGTPTSITANRTGRYVRVQLAAGSGVLSLAEVEVMGTGGGGEGAGASGGIRWLVSDHLGTPRMTADATGSLAGIKRHDYLPFGEELYAGTGGRTTGQGYSQVDNVRQKFTGKERDGETGLDYFLARYYSSAQGRFTSPDEFKGGPHELWVLGSGHPEKQALFYAEITNPQSLNKYQYCFNNPLRYVDPDGQNPQDSFEIKMQQAIRDVNSGRITPEQYWDRLRGAGVGAAAGVAAILAAKAGVPALTAAALWATRNPQAAQQIAQELVQASSGNPAPANLGTPLTSVFNVERNTLTSGKLLFGSLRNAEVAAQFSKSGDTLVAGVVGVFNKTEGLSGSSIKSLLNSVKDFARQEGLAKVEVQAIAVINKDLEKRLLQQGFQRTTVIVDGEKVNALTKTISVR